MTRRTTILIVGLLSLGAFAYGGEPARQSAESTLNERLSALGARVEEFWGEITSVSCVETISQVKVDPERSKTLNRREAVYDYVVFLQLIGGQLAVEESRELREESKAKKVRRPSHRPLLITNGFALSVLIFHPHFQRSYVFENLPDQEWNGSVYHRLAFEHVRGASSPTALQLRDALYPIEWKGTAWIDPDSGQIARLQTGLKSPMEQLGIQRVDVDVAYSSQAASLTTWMPSTASIEAATEHQLWRNRHEFSEYRKFEVETSFEIAAPEHP
jgi:hypothetical protein